MVKKKARTLTPEEYDAVLTAVPIQHRLMVETAINTGLRWGELIALKPRHLDLTTGRLTVEALPSVRRRTAVAPSGQLWTSLRGMWSSRDALDAVRMPLQCDDAGMAEEQIRIEVVDFGGGSGANLRIALRDLPYEVDFDDRSKLVPVQQTQEARAPDMRPEQFDPKNAPHYMPSDPEQWAWIIGSYVTLRVADHLVADAYEQVKGILLQVAKGSAKARVKLNDEPVEAEDRPNLA